MLFSVGVFAQQAKQLDKQHYMSITDSTHIIRFHVLNEEPKVKPKKGLRYAWFAHHQIHTNDYGFDGKLLNGEYSVYDRMNNKLIEKGVYKNGLKQGTWKEWYIDGTLKTVAHYKKGKVRGEIKYYDESGKFIQSQEEEKKNKKDKKEKKEKKTKKEKVDESKKD